MSTAAIRIIETPTREAATEVMLYPLGDTHVGALGFDEQEFARYVNEIESNDNAYWLGLGDYGDLITHKDPRYLPTIYEDWMYTPQALADPGTAQRDYFLEMTRPIWHKCLGLIEGNHEATMKKHLTRDIFREIAGTIEANNPWSDLAFGPQKWVMLKFRQRGQTAPTNTATVWAFHGSGGGAFTNTNKSRAYAASHKANVIITGHTHKEVVFPDYFEEVDRAGNVRIVPIRAVVSGTFKQHGPWEESKGFQPNGTGTSYLVFRPWHRVYGGGSSDEGFHLRRSIEVRI